jgi:hypothetical protein
MFIRGLKKIIIIALLNYAFLKSGGTTLQPTGSPAPLYLARVQLTKQVK